MTVAVSIRDLHDQESLKDFAARIKTQEFNCRSMHRILALAKGVRRAAKLGIDPDYTEALVQFDDEMEVAVRALALVLKKLVTIRERVDKKKVEAARESRFSGWNKQARRKRALAECKPKRYGTKERPLTMDNVRLALKGLNDQQIKNLLEVANSG